MDPYTRLTREWNINVWVREDARLQEVSFCETLCLVSAPRLLSLSNRLHWSVRAWHFFTELVLHPEARHI